ncbi:MAG: Uma2 family endonuclease [Kiritimatiellia bacterium]
MNEPAPSLKATYTWSDYQTWPREERWEIIGGQAFAMSPSPTTRHQKIVTRLASNMEPLLRGGSCEVMVAPMDVRLSNEDVVQPDLLVVCDAQQIKTTHIEGPPRLVVEVLSSSTERMDRLLKRELYARCGVEEYWIVTPFPHLVEVYVLQQGHYVWWKTFDHRDRVTSSIMPDISFDLAQIFDFPLEEGEKNIFIVKEPPAKYSAAAK